ncbi:MAG: hypothetical protein ACOCQB_02860 [Halanaerobiaceae bacterium]
MMTLPFIRKNKKRKALVVEMENKSYEFLMLSVFLLTDKKMQMNHILDDNTRKQLVEKMGTSWPGWLQEKADSVKFCLGKELHYFMTCYYLRTLRETPHIEDRESLDKVIRETALEKILSSFMGLRHTSHGNILEFQKGIEAMGDQFSRFVNKIGDILTGKSRSYTGEELDDFAEKLFTYIRKKDIEMMEIVKDFKNTCAEALPEETLPDIARDKVLKKLVTRIVRTELSERTKRYGVLNGDNSSNYIGELIKKLESIITGMPGYNTEVSREKEEIILNIINYCLDYISFQEVLDRL